MRIVYTLSFVLVWVTYTVGEANNGTNATIPGPRCLSSILGLALNTTTDAVSLGLETGRNWFDFGVNTARNWITGTNSRLPGQTSTSSPLIPVGGQIIPVVNVQSLRAEISRLQSELGSSGTGTGTWLRAAKQRRLSQLIDRLNSLYDRSPDRADPTVTPLDVSRRNPTISSRPGDGSARRQSANDTIISVFS